MLLHLIYKKENILNMFKDIEHLEKQQYINYDTYKIDLNYNLVDVETKCIKIEIPINEEQFYKLYKGLENCILEKMKMNKLEHYVIQVKD